tara:strand:+ start:649 stop:888 length:240 start_codon:yes stop_codon:yes gene_type:complete
LSWSFPGFIVYSTWPFRLDEEEIRAENEKRKALAEMRKAQQEAARVEAVSDLRPLCVASICGFIFPSFTGGSADAEAIY